MKNAIRFACVLLGPAVVVWLFYLYVYHYAENVMGLFVLLHVLTLAWTVLYFRRGMGRVSLLPVSFFVTVAGPYLVDARHPGFFQYIGSLLMCFFYALPWAAVSLIVAVVVLLRRRRGERRELVDEIPGDEA